MTSDPYRLEGVDTRSVRARRYRDLVDAVRGEFPAASVDAVRELAGLKLSQCMLQLEIVAGTAAASARCHGDLVRLSNLIVRKENDLRAVQKQKAITRRRGPTIDDYVARHEGGDDE